MEKYKIVADSSMDMIAMGDVPFASAPLKIITADSEYIDDQDLDVERMIAKLSSYGGKSSTSCPNPGDWLKAFGDAEYIFCITISGAISGSYNAALIAKEMYEEMYPQRHVHVINSLSAGPELKLLAEKISERIAAGDSFDCICQSIEAYKKTTGLVFMLESMKNFANNGRVNPVLAKAAGVLGVRIIGRASDGGELQQLDKCRGQEKALCAIVKRIREFGCRDGKIRIAHCLNEDGAKKLKEMLLSELSKVKIEIYKCRGLCSYYAEKGGLLVGFEKCRGL